MSVCPCGRQTRRTDRSVAVERFDGAGNRLPAVVYCAPCSARIWQACDDFDHQKVINRQLAGERTETIRVRKVRDEWPPSSDARLTRVQVRDEGIVPYADTVRVEASIPE